MNQKISNILISSMSLLVGMTWAGVVLSENFKYRELDHFPIEARECDDFAWERAQSFVENIGTRFGAVTLKGAYCTTDAARGDQSHWNIDIDYVAAERIPLVSTLDSLVLEEPGYKTKEICEDGLANEIEVFTRRTGLPVFAAYCKAPIFDDGKWVINVNGFGRSDVRPLTVSTHLFGTVLGHSRATFLNLITSNLNARGHEVTQIEVNSHLAYITLSMRYYGSELLQINEADIARFTDEQTCASNLEAAKQALNEAGVSTLGTYCYKSSLAGTGTGIATLTDKEGQLNFAKPSRSYSSYLDCEVARPEVVSHYRGQLHRDIKGSFCSKEADNRNFKVVMIEKRS